MLMFLFLILFYIPCKYVVVFKWNTSLIPLIYLKSNRKMYILYSTRQLKLALNYKIFNAILVGYNFRQEHILCVGAMPFFM